MGPAGIEPATRGFSVHCCYLLSYGPIYKTLILCKMLDSNQPPIVYQTIALPCELNSLQVVDLLDVSLGCTRRIRTLSLAYEANELPLLHQCNIKGSFSLTQDYVKGNENRLNNL